MKRAHHILLAVFLLFFSVKGWAQGDVVVHSDPRLSLLLKKNHPAIASSVKVGSHKATSTVPAEESISSHSSEILPAPHTGDMAVRTNAKPPVAPAAKPVVTPTPWISHRNVRTIYTGKGFRVQIYRGTDRSKAMSVKNEFARNNPGVRTYLSYISPCFRVKVGDYRRRVEAEGMWREANSTYNPSMIVPDIITVTTTE